MSSKEVPCAGYARTYVLEKKASAPFSFYFEFTAIKLSHVIHSPPPPPSGRRDCPAKVSRSSAIPYLLQHVVPSVEKRLRNGVILHFRRFGICVLWHPPFIKQKDEGYEKFFSCRIVKEVRFSLELAQRLQRIFKLKPRCCQFSPPNMVAGKPLRSSLQQSNLSDGFIEDVYWWAVAFCASEVRL